jgi:hypothetical protein
MKRKSMKRRHHRGGMALPAARNGAADSNGAAVANQQPPAAAAANQQPPATPAAGTPPANKQAGGKRGKSRKLSPWNKFVAKVYAEMKKADKSASFSQALKEAAKRKKKGEM